MFKLFAAALALLPVAALGQVQRVTIPSSAILPAGHNVLPSGSITAMPPATGSTQSGLRMDGTFVQYGHQAPGQPFVPSTTPGNGMVITGLPDLYPTPVSSARPVARRALPHVINTQSNGATIVLGGHMTLPPYTVGQVLVKSAADIEVVVDVKMNDAGKFDVTTVKFSPGSATTTRDIPGNDVYGETYHWPPRTVGPLGEIIEHDPSAWHPYSSPVPLDAHMPTVSGTTVTPLPVTGPSSFIGN